MDSSFELTPRIARICDGMIGMKSRLGSCLKGCGWSLRESKSWTSASRLAYLKARDEIKISCDNQHSPEVPRFKVIFK